MNRGYRWAASGDINAFFGLLLDNMAGLILMVTLLEGFGMPRDFVLGRMIPGTAIGVDVRFRRVGRRTGRDGRIEMGTGDERSVGWQ